MENSDLRFVALLRGINVGGKNLISKQELLRCFEDLGFTNVRTYIQSGNILFRSTNKNPEQLTTTIEEGLSVRFSYSARVALLSHDQYKEAVASAPASWGKDDRQLHNALFTLGEITPREFLAHLPPPKHK